jgi:hypothetical protein
MQSSFKITTFEFRSIWYVMANPAVQRTLRDKAAQRL